MSRKTIAFATPASPVARPLQAGGGIGAEASDAWVSRRDAPAAVGSSDAPRAMLLDLAADRTLFEVFTLSMLAPFALGWFWFARAMAGQARF